MFSRIEDHGNIMGHFGEDRKCFLSFRFGVAHVTPLRDRNWWKPLISGWAGGGQRGHSSQKRELAGLPLLNSAPCGIEEREACELSPPLKPARAEGPGPLDSHGKHATLGSKN